MRHPILCDTCEGLGRVNPDAFSDRTFRCHNGCTNGYFEATAVDLDGKRARYRYVTGWLWIWKGVLCLENDEGDLIVNLQPEDVEVLP